MSTTPTRAKRRREVRIVSKPKVPLPPQLKRVNLNAAGIESEPKSTGPAVPPGRKLKGGTCAGWDQSAAEEGRLAEG